MEGSIGSYNDGTYAIMDIHKLFKKNYLTFFHNPDYGSVRYKFYNKCAQLFKNTNVRCKIGSHIAGWLYNPDEQLRKQN